MRNLTGQEERVVELLGEAWNEAQTLNEISPNSSDHRELMEAIHAAQNIVLARPAYEQQIERRYEERPELTDEQWDALLKPLHEKLEQPSFITQQREIQKRIIEDATSK